MKWEDLKPGDVVLSPDEPNDPSFALPVLRNDGERITWLGLEDGGSVKEGGSYRPGEAMSPALALAPREGE